MKKLITTIAAMTLIAIANTSCSRETNKETKAEARLPDILYQPNINPTDVFTLSRNGHVVNIQFHVDLSACWRVEIRRNSTGTTANWMPVARFLDKKPQSHEDIVPDAGPHWYWVGVWPPKGSILKWVGPLRAAPDEANIGNYTKLDETYKIHASRNETSARIGWDAPKESFKYLMIRRNTSMHTRKQTMVLDRVLERSGQVNDVLPDPHADYWYWMEVILENGTLITRGPVKAEYREE